MAGIIFAFLFAIAAAFIAGTLIYRKLRQRKAGRALRIDNADGFVEEGFVSIGGIEQWIGIRGEDWRNPVLLMIHGGPGAPSSIFTPLLRTWERHFTVVQWEQRGSGKTLGRNGRDQGSALTLEQLICDGIEVTMYLRERLRKNQVILLASSFGTTFGLSMVRRRPELFSAYVGTDQNVGMVRGCEASHRATVKRLRRAGLEKGVATLEKLGADAGKWTAKQFTAIAQWTLKSDPVSCGRIMKLLKSAILFSPGHSLIDIRDFMRGMRLSIESLFPEVPGYDAWQQGTAFDVPFFIFQGERDVVTLPSLARVFFEDVKAPAKEFVLIQGAGHFAAFTHADQFLSELLRRVKPRVVTATGRDARAGGAKACAIS